MTRPTHKKQDSDVTYGLRLSEYQRRESMTIWVAAGIAALIGVLNAHALNHRYTQIVLSLCIIAGATLAQARVGFEWKATQLKREIGNHFTLQDKLIGETDKWPRYYEICWSISRSVQAAAWALTFIGIWIGSSQPTPPAIRTSVHLTTFSIGSVSRFGDCSADSFPAPESQLDHLVKSYQDHLGSNARAALIILVGTADNRRLSPACLSRFGTNEQLAHARANYIRTQLEAMLSGEPIQPSYIAFASGPRHLESKSEFDGRDQDRAVNAWVIIDTFQNNGNEANGTPQRSDY